MFYVYVLESERNGKYYVGSTAQPEDRLKAHNAGKVRSTKAYLPYRIIHKEAFLTYTEARRRELDLKKRKSRRFIRELVCRGVA
ncbi:MAG: GIY-YIG nuclease family protein [Candidatus Margulisbacteria bacterium]|nr:GIY-YIG nuclease family protein [Candidatus Margulisiibacteriota bacterium]